jgi:hypothetical protein
MSEYGSHADRYAAEVLGTGLVLGAVSFFVQLDTFGVIVYGIVVLIAWVLLIERLFSRVDSLIETKIEAREPTGVDETDDSTPNVESSESPADESTAA